LKAAAVCYVFGKSDLVEDLDELLLGRVKRFASILGISFLPAFVCWPLLSYGDHLLVEKDLDPRQKTTIMHRLLDCIQNEASKHNLPVAFVNVMDRESALIEMLNRRGYNKSVHIPLNFIDMGWTSFDEYLTFLGNLSSNSKKTVRREINRNRREGTVVEPLRIRDKHEERLHQLLDMNCYKHNGRPFSFSKSFLHELQSNLGEDVVFYVSWKGGVLTGTSVVFKRNGMIHLPMIGVDHAMTGDDYTYFYLGFYKPMMDAVSNGTKRFYAGRGMYETKARRGFRTANLYIYYRASTKTMNMAIKPWFALLSEWNQLKIRGLTRTNGPNRTGTV
ncbi:MAG: GNAT family N-acetyltransferase, partial [Deltaproteobacteria bacterium]|nr:GNAT family N-acetyltransferase [Deltaproteobacteria bacterium]